MLTSQHWKGFLKWDVKVKEPETKKDIKLKQIILLNQYKFRETIKLKKCWQLFAICDTK